MNRKGIVFLIIAVVVIAAAVWWWQRGETASCRSAPNVGTPPAIEVVRMDQLIEKAPDSAALVGLINQHDQFFEYFMQRSQLPDDSIIVNDLVRLHRDRYIDTLYQEVQAHYRDLKPELAELGQAVGYLRHYYPQHPVPRVYTLVSGFSADIVAYDSVIVWALDAFMGDSSRYHPPMTPKYMQARMRKPFLVPGTMTMLSSMYLKSDMLDNTLLADMIRYGKAYYFTEQTMPCAPDSVIIGYTAKQVAESQEHADIIWSHFTKNRLFFETNHMNKNRYVGERPSVQEIGPDCPGRIGRWLGWQIVRAYAKNTGATLPQIMAETDAKKIMNQSKYRPE